MKIGFRGISEINFFEPLPPQSLFSQLYYSELQETKNEIYFSLNKMLNFANLSTCQNCGFENSGKMQEQ